MKKSEIFEIIEKRSLQTKITIKLKQYYRVIKD